MPNHSVESGSDEVQSALAIYLREINDTPLLDADQEKQLAYRIEKGDMEARDQMIRANLRLVVNMAREYTGKGLSLQDLIEEGNLGLIRAVQGFDPRLNTRFSTYASYWIKQSIKRSLINTGKTIRIPAYMVELITKWRRRTPVLEEVLGKVPTHAEVARSLGLPAKKLPIIEKALRTSVAQNMANNSEDSFGVAEMLEDPRNPPVQGIEDTEELNSILDQIGRMHTREQSVIQRRFGLGGREVETLKEIGESLGITRERVRQIESEAIGKIQRKIYGLDSSDVPAEGSVQEQPVEISLSELLSELNGERELVEYLLTLTKKDLLTCLNGLTNLQQSVLTYRLGLATKGTYLSYAAIASRMQISQRKVRSFERNGLQKIQKSR